MVPATWPPSAANDAALRDYVAARGERALQQAVSCGPERIPGRPLLRAACAPAWSNGFLRRVLREAGAAARAARAGSTITPALGPARARRDDLQRRPASGRRRAREGDGGGPRSPRSTTARRRPPRSPASTAARSRDECPGVAYAGIALEFGTLPMLAVLQALRADQWLSNHPDAPADTRAAIKRAVRDAFYQDADDWKAQLLRAGAAVRARCYDSARRGPVTPAHERRAPSRGARDARQLGARLRARVGRRRRLELPAFAGGDRLRSPCSPRASSGRCSRRGSRRTTRSTSPRSRCPTRACRPCGARAASPPSRSAPTTRDATCSRRSCSARASRCWSAWRRCCSRWCSGVALGLVAGYAGGKTDAFIMRVADVQLSFPAILIALLIDGVARVALPRERTTGSRSSCWCSPSACPTGSSTRARCAARRWWRRARNTCRPRG